MSNINKKPCPKCGFHFNCICQYSPNLISTSQFVLLLHPNEHYRLTNTGKLVQQSLSSCLSFTWDRVNPPQALLKLIADKQYNTVLLFPNNESQPISQETIHHSGKASLFIILDSTWQEAKKMVRKSPWLQSLVTTHLLPVNNSAYTLRRNQQDGNLCTCETVTELLHLLGESDNAKKLDDFFHLYLNTYKADKNKHRL
ncbi:DTW domain-containing protein [Vibrio sp. TH_r3]|uniref:tRNA-uridine aminocarboxypropyltransferase n=1 Tax=Vibrio sp. TH_r3 TaxID=3082084 RepID=UPI002953F133|nr:DTW domain-containing protein [Vibrio sp. TH_r3]MDV7106064.1 DTW domain-containing protein [Vibrio sp. TH_r3]